MTDETDSISSDEEEELQKRMSDVTAQCSVDGCTSRDIHTGTPVYMRGTPYWVCAAHFEVFALVSTMRIAHSFVVDNSSWECEDDDLDKLIDYLGDEESGDEEN